MTANIWFVLKSPPWRQPRTHSPSPTYSLPKQANAQMHVGPAMVCVQDFGQKTIIICRDRDEGAGN